MMKLSDGTKAILKQIGIAAAVAVVTPAAVRTAEKVAEGAKLGLAMIKFRYQENKAKRQKNNK